MTSAQYSKYKRYLQSKEWAEIRISIIENRKKCERCEDDKHLEIHHKTYRNLFKEEPKDLELLCRKCHYHEHYTNGKRKFKITLAQKSQIKKAKNKHKHKYKRK